MVLKNKKELGQNWLKDRQILATIAEYAESNKDDTILEIGPGLGTLTSELLKRSGKVVAVEFDVDLARKLPGQFPNKNLEVINQDILKFDLSMLPTGYKVVANVPYYITSKIIEKLLTAINKPSVVVILVQKEVAERVAAEVGDLSLLGISAQVFADVELGMVVPKEYFTPAPKVDSQIVVLHTRETPIVTQEDEKLFFRLVRAGFAEKRKKLRSSISAGLGISKVEAEEMLVEAGIYPSDRAQDVPIEEWLELMTVYKGWKRKTSD